MPSVFSAARLRHSASFPRLTGVSIATFEEMLSQLGGPWDAAQARVVAHIGRRRWGRLSASLLEIAEQVRTWTPEEIA